MASVCAVLRRHEEPEPFALGELAGGAVDLTASEYELLRTLSQNAGRVVPFDTLTARLWPDRDGGDANRVRNFVKQLRDKLGDRAANPPRIFNVRGVGYLMPRPDDAGLAPAWRARRRTSATKGRPPCPASSWPRASRTMNSGQGCRMPVPASPGVAASQRTASECALIVRLLTRRGTASSRKALRTAAKREVGPTVRQQIPMEGEPVRVGRIGGDGLVDVCCRRGRGVLRRAGRTARTFVLPSSVFHGLSTGAIPSDRKAAVGRRWETRCRISGIVRLTRPRARRRRGSGTAGRAPH